MRGKNSNRWFNFVNSLRRILLPSRIFELGSAERAEKRAGSAWKFKIAVGPTLNSSAQFSPRVDRSASKRQISAFSPTPKVRILNFNQDVPVLPVT